MSFEGKVEYIAERMAQETYGYGRYTFLPSLSFELKDKEEQQNGLPIIRRGADKNVLVIPAEGNLEWEDAIGGVCEEVDIDPEEVYAATGIALLELANVVNYAVNANDTVPRLRKIHKVFSNDKPTVQVSNKYSEQAGIDFTTVVRDLDPEDVMTVQKLRYGMGVALQTLLPNPSDRSMFAEVNSKFATTAIVNYVQGVSGFLNRILLVEDLPKAKDMTAETITEDISYKEFPFITIAASIPMNVGYLLNKS